MGSRSKKLLGRTVYMVCRTLQNENRGPLFKNQDIQDREQSITSHVRSFSAQNSGQLYRLHALEAGPVSFKDDFTYLFIFGCAGPSAFVPLCGLSLLVANRATF